MQTPIILPCYIESTDGQTRIKDADGITVADCAPHHAEEIARALNKQIDARAAAHEAAYLESHQ